MHKLTNRTMKSVAIVMCFMFVLSACAKKEEALTVTTSTVEEIAEEVPEVPQDPSTASLLTNEVKDKDLSKVRPLGVMFENTKAALPHYGLCDAGVIYEMPAEGGITRYLALFDDYEGYERLGNIRSARPYYVEKAAEFDAILAHIGQSIYAEILLRSLHSDTGIVDDINGVLGGTSFITFSDKSKPHNTYLSSENIIKDIESHGFSRELPDDAVSNFAFSDTENLLENGTDCTEAHLYFYHNKPYFKYDPETKLYTRYEFGDVERDALSDDGTIKVSNIVVQHVDSSTHANDPYIDVDVVSSGTGKFLTRGKIIDITWELESDYTTRYYDKDGNQIEFNTGKTFICMAENSGIEGNTYE